MIFDKQIELLRRMDQLIRIKRTGPPKVLASRMGVSESTLFEKIKTAREMGAQISYNSYRETYEYDVPMKLTIGFFEKEEITDLKKVRGGTCKMRKHLTFTAQYLRVS